MTRDIITAVPTKRDQHLASTSIGPLKKSVDKLIAFRRTSARIRVMPNSDDYLEIPMEVLMLLKEILSNMAMGRIINLFPSDIEISTQQAADMLNISRPHLIKLLESGQIPFNKAGTHRRVAVNDIVAYKSALAKTRKSELDFLAEQAQELNLGY